MDFLDTYIILLTNIIDESADTDSVNIDHLRRIKRLKIDFSRRSEAEKLRHERTRRSMQDRKQGESHSKFLQQLNKLNHI